MFKNDSQIQKGLTLQRMQLYIIHFSALIYELTF